MAQSNNELGVATIQAGMRLQLANLQKGSIGHHTQED